MLLEVESGTHSTISTPQYAALEQLFEELRDKNFAIVGFPCNRPIIRASSGNLGCQSLPSALLIEPV